MDEFFHGRRRQTGLVTLVMALAFMSFWLISLRSPDCLLFQFTMRYAWMFAWDDSYFSMSEIRDMHADNDLSDNIEPFIAFRNLISERDNEIQRINGSHFACFQKTAAKYHFQGAIFPLWSVVIPLTLLSAWLVLSNPHKLSSKKITEPTSTERA